MTSEESPPLQSASQVAVAFFAALRDAHWDDAVALVDVRAQAEFHRAEVADLLARAQHRAEFRRMRDSAGGSFGYSPQSAANRALLEEFGAMPVVGIEGVATIADYAALPPAELLARHLEAGNGPVHRLLPSRLSRIKSRLESQPDGDLGAVLPARPTPSWQVIGEILESIGADRIAHVIYRRVRSEASSAEDSEGADPLSVEVLHLRNRSGWRVVLSGRDFMLFGTPWFEPDYDWEPGRGSPQAG